MVRKGDTGGFRGTDDDSHVNLSKGNSCLHIGFRIVLHCIISCMDDVCHNFNFYFKITGLIILRNKILSLKFCSGF